MADDILGGKQIPNPKNLHPSLDTDPDRPPVKNKNMQGDISNAPLSEPNMDIHGVFNKPEFRHQPGHSVPKNSPIISEN